MWRSSTKIAGVDARGRPTSEKVRGISKQSVRLGNVDKSLAELGPAWLLQTLLFPADAEPRIALEGADHRGVALLAEMAIDYDRVLKAYQSYLASPAAADAEIQSAIRTRIGRHNRERQAAQAWRTANQRAAEVKLYLDAHDPTAIGDESFREGGKAKELLDNESMLNRLLMEARDAEATLLDPDLADTIWGAILRKNPAPNARYADEPPVEEIPEDEPAEPTEAPTEEPAKAPTEGSPEDGATDTPPAEGD